LTDAASSSFILYNISLGSDFGMQTIHGHVSDSDNPESVLANDLGERGFRVVVATVTFECKAKGDPKERNSDMIGS
jgi:hypothetical protein